ncbi:hypothetical protein RND81_02G154800 [Saponaria officinalis]|uniref:F-box associated beta-propeller type 1 domain-containing protein n=1 Tax=Saponaria officinalis TaxID=3572 RepID=A0AAW1MY72_SAPOF
MKPEILEQIERRLVVEHSTQFFSVFTNSFYDGMDNKKKPSSTRVLNKTNNMMYMTFKEILREHALRYLPAKSLYRYNAVCKDWKHLISTPFFEHTQSYFSCSLSGLFSQTPGGSITFVSLDPMSYGVPDPGLKFLPEPVDLVASSNGLLCCRGRTENKAYYICNPVNREWKKLPKPEADHGYKLALVLVFEPSLVKFEVEYKLICAFPSPDFHGAYEFEIYTSIDNSWNISTEICFGERTRILDRKGVHQNGVAYWLTDDHFLIGYDLNKNRATLIPCYGSWLGSDILGGYYGKPCISRRQGPDIVVSFLSNVYGNTMQMSFEEKIWEKRRVALKSEWNVDGGSVLAIGGGVVVFHDGSRIVVYNLSTKETKSLGSQSEYNSDCFYVPYVNSVVRLQ